MAPDCLAVSFAGVTVTIGYECRPGQTFLDLLFADQAGRCSGDEAPVLQLSAADPSGRHTLSAARRLLHRGRLDVGCAAALFDAVIFRLLRLNDAGVALHAGAVAHREQLIVLPGPSGSGKSSVSAWLAARGYSYLTDELIFLPRGKKSRVQPFVRPACLKPGSAGFFRPLIGPKSPFPGLEDNQGLVIPHRALNPDFARISGPPALLLFPSYQQAALPVITKISPARACALLMACDVNGRNLDDHGFAQMADLARSVPAYRLTYGSFRGLEERFAELLHEMAWC